MAFVDPLIGQTLSNYRLDHLLGRGGMARVYFGWDIRLHRPVAIKVLDERYRENPAYTARFVREARAVATWNHPNISKVYFAGEEDGWPFFVMEYVRGLDLQQILRQYSSVGELMPYLDVLRIGRAVASALDYAHTKGVIHRDVKPSNVIVSDDGRVVLTDFGLAMNVAQGTMGEVFGSPHYIAPEQARNSAEAVPESDVYSLGVMLYEMLTGSVPFDDPSPTALALKHLTQDPPSPRRLNPALSPQIEVVLLKALAKQPRDRYRSAGELIDALEDGFEGGQDLLRPATLPYIPRYESADSGDDSQPRPTLSRIEVAEKVKEYLSGQSTARSPAPTQPKYGPQSGGNAAAYPASGPATGTGRQPGAQPSSVKRLAVGCFLLLLFAALASGLGLGYAFRNRGGSPGTATSIAGGLPVLTATWTSTVQPSATFTEISPTPEISPTAGPPTDTPAPSLTPSFTPTATKTDTPTPVATLDPDADYRVLFFKYDDNLYVINLSDGDIPMAPLQMSNNKGKLEGTEWELSELASGECVAAFRTTRRGDPDFRNVEIIVFNRRCDPMGEQLIRDPRDLFWTDTFNVYFGDQLVGRCEKDKDFCIIQF